MGEGSTNAPVNDRIVEASVASRAFEPALPGMSEVPASASAHGEGAAASEAKA